MPKNQEILENSSSHLGIEVNWRGKYAIHPFETVSGEGLPVGVNV